MSIAVTAAEMGILVMGTLHTNGAAATVDRLVNAFPGRQAAARAHHAVDQPARRGLAAAACRKADKQGRVAALEILINTPGGRQPDPPGQAGSAGKRHADRLRRPACGHGRGDPARCSISGIITGKEAYKKAINKANSSRFATPN